LPSACICVEARADVEGGKDGLIFRIFPLDDFTSRHLIQQMAHNARHGGFEGTDRARPGVTRDGAGVFFRTTLAGTETSANAVVELLASVGGAGRVGLVSLAT